MTLKCKCSLSLIPWCSGEDFVGHISKVGVEFLCTLKLKKSAISKKRSVNASLY